MTTTLSLCALSPHVRTLYGKTLDTDSTGRDSGYDLYCPSTVTIPAGETGKIKLGVSAQPDGLFGYFLFPRSSIYKTPLRLANSIGLIDADYRGEIMAVVDNRSNEAYTVEEGTRLFQLVMPDARPFRVQFVESLDETARGEGGFGSTGV